MIVNFLFDHKVDNHSNHVKRKWVSRYGNIENGSLWQNIEVPKLTKSLVINLVERLSG